MTLCNTLIIIIIITHLAEQAPHPLDRVEVVVELVVDVVAPRQAPLPPHEALLLRLRDPQSGREAGPQLHGGAGEVGGEGLHQGVGGAGVGVDGHPDQLAHLL